MDRFERLAQQLREKYPGLEQRTEEPMSRHTTFRVGGPVRLMALPRSEQEAAAVLRAARELEIEPFFLGNGSNLLVADAGAECFVVKTAGGLTACEIQGERMSVGGGLLLAKAAWAAQEHGLSGLEFAHGIPGTMGGATLMNAGAYRGEMAQVVRQVTCLTSEGEVQQVTDCGFAYRRSVFEDGKRLILRVELMLHPGDRETIRARMDDLMERRREKQPLEYPSAGSTFKRPEGYFAAALIDQCGLKGLRVGGAQVSEKHAGFLINRGGATCGDILALAEQVRTRVLQQTGVQLELEIKTLGL